MGLFSCLTSLAHLLWRELPPALRWLIPARGHDWPPGQIAVCQRPILKARVTYVFLGANLHPSVFSKGMNCLKQQCITPEFLNEQYLTI